MTNLEDRVERALHALAEHVEPDVAAARIQLAGRDAIKAAPPRRVARPRAWVTLAAASVAVIGLGSLIAVGTTWQPAAQTDPTVVPPEPSDVPLADISVADISVAGTVSSSMPSTSFPLEPSTTVVDTLPDIPAPERLAVVDPRPGAEPVRSDPVVDWVHGATTPPPRRWFIRRSIDGTPTGGVSVTESAIADWVTTFHDAPSAGIAGVDARVVTTPTSAQVAWMTDDGVRVVAGLGDVELDETIAVAHLATAATDLEGVTAPEGFEEVAVPVEEGTVLYEDTMVTIAFSTVSGGTVDVAAAAFMTAGREGPISQLPGDDAWLTTTFGGHPTAVVGVGADGIATVVGMPSADVESLTSTIAVVPASEITIANAELTHGIPADATRTYGEIDRGRWLVYEYTSMDGSTCFSVDGAWGGSGDCSPPGRSCPIAEVFSGPSSPSGFEVFVPYVVDELRVTLDGEPAEATIEHAQGFTFAYGPAPSANATIEVTIDGQTAC